MTGKCLAVLALNPVHHGAGELSLRREGGLGRGAVGAHITVDVGSVQHGVNRQVNPDLRLARWRQASGFIGGLHADTAHHRVQRADHRGMPPQATRVPASVTGDGALQKWRDVPEAAIWADGVSHNVGVRPDR